MFFIKERVEVICEQLKKQYLVKKLEINDWYMKEGNFLHPEDADADSRQWTKFDSKKDHWYGPDCHYWFKTSFTVADDMDNKPLWLVVRTQVDEWDDGRNPQFLLFINGNPVQGLDMNHREVLLTNSASVGDIYDIQLAAYTGILHTEFSLMAEVYELIRPVYELYYDIAVPLWMLDSIGKDEKNRYGIETILNNTINMLDFREIYSPEYFKSVENARNYIQKALYEEMGGFEDFIATCVGHTHIDVAWWWTVEQTKEKVARSFSTVLKLMDEYPEYIFMSSQPQLYLFVKERYPELYEKIKQRIYDGRWEAEGGMWLEADCNVTSGESLVRQFLHGKRFFKEEFNVDSVILWLPDVFGYSAALPQIMKKSGIKYFMTTKLSWNQFNKIPYDTFFWRGIDGSEIFTHMITTRGIKQDKDSFFTTYNGILHPNSLMGGWERYQQKAINNDILVSYGYGDGGGGPTRQMLETGRRMQKGIKGSIKVRFASAQEYFDNLYERVADNPRLPKWVGELYFEYHRGTYTSMARNKRSNRKLELALQDLEFLSVWAENLGLKYPKDDLFNMWQTMLLNQFHDILPGSSVKEVYETTRAEYEKIGKTVKKLIDIRTKALANTVGGDLVLFNTLSFKRNDIAVIDGIKGTALVDETGRAFVLQPTNDGKMIAYVENIPAKGCKAFTLSSIKNKFENRFVFNDLSVETPYYKVIINDKGNFVSIYDKENEREILKGNGNVLKVYEDKPMYYDCWDIDIYYTEKSWIVDNVKRIEWVERGPVRATLLVEYVFPQVYIRQKIHFYSNMRRIDFEDYVDWKLSQHLLKVEFPVDVNAAEATYDIQFGNIKRPTHRNTKWDIARFEVCGHKWADLSEGGYGVSLLNDCKYGYGIHNGNMTLTLIKSGIEPNPTADQEEHHFTYSLLPHSGDWKDAGVAEQGYMLNVPFYAVITDNCAGSGIKTNSLIEIDGDNVILETVKKSEDLKGVIIRLYEYKNSRGKVTVKWFAGCCEVYECDLMENVVNGLPSTGGEFTFNIMPFEIKTFKII